MVIEQNINKGYTLIELVITIVLIAIIFSVAGIFLALPIQIYTNVVSRAALVDIADLTLRRIERDLHQALPNSIRVKSANGKQSIEMVNTVIGKRYRDMWPGTDANILSFDIADTAFNVFGQFPASMLGNNNYRLVIYNIGANGVSADDPIAGVNVYAANNSLGPNPPAGTHVITPASTTITLSNIGTEGHIALNPGFQFALTSPQQRLYIIDTPISYVCVPSNATLTRYYGYAINTVQPMDPSFVPLNTAQADLVANYITACMFEYQPGTSERGGIVTITLTVSDGVEQINLLQQVHVSNIP